MTVHPEEGKVVRQMFERYECGATLNEVTDWLNAAGLPSPRGKAWRLCVVRDMLMNEVYMGDMVLQKFRTVDHLSHRSVRNDATEVPCYYITDHHPAIVSRETFGCVQRIRALRSNFDGHIPQYPYGDTQIRCPLCGAPLVQRNTRGNYKTRLVLGCFAEGGCGGFAIRRHVFSGALLRAYNEMDASRLAPLAAMPEARRFLRLKEARPTMETVEYYWLEELVECIELTELESTADSSAGCWEIAVRWRCGLTSRTAVYLGGRYSAPAALTALYYANEAKYRARKAEKARGVAGTAKRTAPGQEEGPL